jgi:glycosyltransferase involved in cell wall biosynthesis
MACGLPVIVSENTFGRDVVTDNADGYVVPIRDSLSISERLRQLAESPATRIEMGNAAAIRARDFSWERYGERTSAFIRRTIDASGKQATL